MPSPFEELLKQLEGIPTSDVPLISWHHKLCFLAVVMGEKPAFAIGFDEWVPPRLVQFLSQRAPLLRLFLKETRRPPRLYLSRAKVPEAVGQAIGERWDKTPRASQRILWVYKDPEQGEAIDEVEKGKQETHRALGYPDCCAEAYWSDRVRAVEAYHQALVGRYGSEEEKVLEMVRRNVEVRATLSGGGRVVQTLGRFPFIPFIACESCLAGDDSEAGGQNWRFRRMMLALDALAARKIELLAEAVVQKAGKK